MAQEQNRGGNQQTQQAQQNRAAAPNADPFSDPVAYLRSKGWKCLGNPEWERALWLDPTKPLREEIRKTPRFGWVRQTVPGKFDSKGAPLVEPQWVQLRSQDGSGIPNQTVPIEQYEITPKVEPMLMQVALMVQMERDLAAEQPAQAAQKQAS